MHPLVLVGLGVGVWEGLRLEVSLGLGNQAAISRKGCIIWQDLCSQHGESTSLGINNKKNILFPRRIQSNYFCRCFATSFMRALERGIGYTQV